MQIRSCHLKGVGSVRLCSSGGTVGGSILQRRQARAPWSSPLIRTRGLCGRAGPACFPQRALGGSRGPSLWISSTRQSRLSERCSPDVPGRYDYSRHVRPTFGPRTSDIHWTTEVGTPGHGLVFWLTSDGTGTKASSACATAACSGMSGLTPDA